MRQAELILELHGIIFSTVLFLFLAFGSERHEKDIKAMLLVLLCNIMNLLSDMGAIIFRGKMTEAGFYIVRISNFSLFLFQMFLCLAMAGYVYQLLKKNGAKLNNSWFAVIGLMETLGIVLLMMNPFTGWFFTIDENNLYHRGPLLPLSMGLGLLAAALTLWQGLSHWQYLEHRKRFTIVGYYSFPVIGLLIQTFWYGYSFLNIGITIAIVILAAEVIVKNSRKKQERKLLLLQSKAYLMNPQISPQYMFGTLDMIQKMINEEPENASDAIGYFSKLLRKAMNFKVSEGMIPIQEELEYTHNYLNLAEIEFGDRLAIVYDIGKKLDFKVPFLTIQPLVENIIRTGFLSAGIDETLHLRVFQMENEANIEIYEESVLENTGSEEEDYSVRWDKAPDDRTGAAENKKNRMEQTENDKIRTDQADNSSEEKENGISIQDVEERLLLMAGASLQRDTTKENGIKILISIPI